MWPNTHLPYAYQYVAPQPQLYVAYSNPPPQPPPVLYYPVYGTPLQCAPPDHRTPSGQAGYGNPFEYPVCEQVAEEQKENADGETFAIFFTFFI